MTTFQSDTIIMDSITYVFAENCFYILQNLRLERSIEASLLEDIEFRVRKQTIIVKVTYLKKNNKIKILLETENMLYIKKNEL